MVIYRKENKIYHDVLSIITCVALYKFFHCSVVLVLHCDYVCKDIKKKKKNGVVLLEEACVVR